MDSVTHVTASVSTFGGGIPEALSSLVSAQFATGLEVNAIGHRDSGTEIDRWPGHHLSALPTKRLPWMTWAPAMKDTLRNQSPTIIHTHGLWTQASLTVPGFATKSNTPYLVSPHGMLDEWALNCSRAKKKLAAKAFENRHLKNASCLHALCKPEEQAFRRFGIKGPIATIPNGIDLPESIDREDKSHKRKILLFLGRIHPKKGLINAIQAFAKVKNRGDWLFVIAGWDQENHLSELHHLCDSLNVSRASIPISELQSRSNISADIAFVGPAFGKEKDLLFRLGDALILPSFSEGMPMTVLEAWSYQLPVAMTVHCNIPEGFAAGAAVELETKIDRLAEKLTDFFDLSETKFREMGTYGRTLVEDRFTWPRIASEMIEVYCWLLGERPRPDSVVTQ
ncbi:MAG: glycosyltransferase [Rhizobiaceae bacterium]|nr:glycosyltransferase [Rhizobiaceae bacterium]